jgi:adenosylhomocysteine nucleosidase
MITGIVVALPEELSTLTSKPVTKSHCVFIAKQLLVAYSGTGYQNAQQAAELLITKGITHLISWGCAGGLSPALHPGDLLLAESIKDEAGNKIILDPDAYLHSKWVLAKSHDVHGGCLLSCSQVVMSSNEKNQLHLKTGAVAVDMESLAIAQVAQQHGLPFLAIRAIADPANSSLPCAVTDALNDQGDVVLTKVLWSALRHPLQIPDLIRLGNHFKAAKTTLKQVASHLEELFVARPN